jgi:hypothetical protein
MTDRRQCLVHLVRNGEGLPELPAVRHACLFGVRALLDADPVATKDDARFLVDPIVRVIDVGGRLIEVWRSEPVSELLQLDDHVFMRSRRYRVVITRADGSQVHFTVDRVQSFPKESFPTETVYAPSLHAGLRLVTCGGDFDRSTGHYLDNVIAFASPPEN